jgi:Dolichyl-phosphate-mannose-protein mannosyltransferase
MTQPTELTELRSPFWRRDRVAECLFLIGLAVGAAFIGLIHVSCTGPLWPDSPRYANGAAMIHDWLRSGELSRPLDFARDNYVRYPGFSIPFHPPGYPGLLGLVFLVTGVSYTVARAFSAVCLAVSAILFYRIQRGLEVPRLAAGATSLLFLTTPGIAHWARDTMSEVPSLPFALAGTLFFLAWLRDGGAWRCSLAFALALVAFFCRLTTAGILPAWFLFALATGKTRRLFSPSLLLPTAGYLGAGFAWVKFAARYGRFEASADGRGSGFSVHNFAYFADVLPEMLLWGTVVIGLAGLVWLLCRRENWSPAGSFWVCWLLSYAVFKLMIPTTPETRHFFAGLPAFAGLAGCLFTVGLPGVRRLAWPLAGAALAANLVLLSQMPAGVVGYDAAAEHLAGLPRPGNILLACWEDQEMIFRYRTWFSPVQRNLIRADRTLAIRLPDYARRQAEIRAHTAADVLDVIGRGRARYLITCMPEGDWEEDRTEEMILAHRTARDRPDLFAPRGSFPVFIQFGGPGRPGKLYLWEYQGPLPDSPSELPVYIPTAGMVIPPGAK